MSFDFILHTVDTISLVDATVSEDSSFYFHVNYEETFPLYSKYTSLDHNIKEVIDLVNLFSTFHGRIRVSENSMDSVLSKIPIEVFRYKRLEDGSFYYVKTIPSKYKDGDIIEGAFWSNGMFCIERDQTQIKLATLYVDSKTKDLYKYP